MVTVDKLPNHQCTLWNMFGAICTEAKYLYSCCAEQKTVCVRSITHNHHY